MPDTTSPEPDEAAAKSGKSRLIIVGALCAVIAAAGFVLGGRMSGGAAAAPDATDATVPEEETEPHIVEIVELEPLNVNLAGGHYLRLAVALGLSEEALPHEEGGGGHGAAKDDGPPIETAPASDLVLTTFSGRTMEDLATPEGRESARHDLLAGLEAYYGEGVITVLFTEFVMQ